MLRDGFTTPTDAPHVCTCIVVRYTGRRQHQHFHQEGPIRSPRPSRAVSRVCAYMSIVSISTIDCSIQPRSTPHRMRSRFALGLWYAWYRLHPLTCPVSTSLAPVSLSASSHLLHLHLSCSYLRRFNLQCLSSLSTVVHLLYVCRVVHRTEAGPVVPPRCCIALPACTL